jgi:hypothetical protein
MAIYSLCHKVLCLLCHRSEYYWRAVAFCMHGTSALFVMRAISPQPLLALPSRRRRGGRRLRRYKIVVVGSKVILMPPGRFVRISKK